MWRGVRAFRGDTDHHALRVTATSGALLQPAPVSLVLTHPILDPTTSFYTTPSKPLPSSPGSKRRSKRLETILSRVGQTDQAIAAASDVETYKESDSASSSNNPFSGWDPSWWRSRVSSRSKERPGQAQGRERSSLYAAVRRSGQLPNIVQAPYRLADVVTGKGPGKSNTPYPPVLLLSAGDDEYIDPLGAAQFLNALRAADPAAAMLDRLLDRSLIMQASAGSTRPSRDAESMSYTVGGELFDPMRRFTQRVVLDRRARHGFDVLVGRDDERFAGEFDAIEAFLANWMRMADETVSADGHEGSKQSKGNGRVAKL